MSKFEENSIIKHFTDNMFVYIFCFVVIVLSIVFTNLNQIDDQEERSKFIFNSVLAICMTGLAIGLSYGLYQLVAYLSNSDSMNKKPLEYTYLFFIAILLLVAIVVMLLKIPFLTIIDSLLDLLGMKGENGHTNAFTGIMIIVLLLVTLTQFNLMFKFLPGSEHYIPYTAFAWGLAVLIALLGSSIVFNRDKASGKKYSYPFFGWGLLVLGLITVINNYIKFIPVDNNIINLTSPVLAILFTFLGLSSFLKNDFYSLRGGIIAVILVMALALINDFIAKIFINLEPATVYIFSGAIALILFLIISGKLLDFKEIPNSQNIFEEIRRNSGFLTNIIFYIILIGVILYSGYRYYTVIKDDISATEQYEVIKDTILFVFPILLIAIFGTNIFNGSNSSLTTLIYALVTLALIFGYFYAISNLSNTRKEQLNYVVSVLFILFVIFGLALVFLLTGNYMASLKGIPGIISYIIFYIPCMVIQLIDYIRKELNMVTPTVGIVFIIELIIIISYLYIPKYVNNLTKLSAIDIVKEPLILNEEKVLPGGDKFKILKSDDLTNQIESKDRPRYNYAVSMWVNLNSNEGNSNVFNNETNIISYDNKPGVYFKINVEGCNAKTYPEGSKDGCHKDDPINQDNMDGRKSNFIFILSNKADPNTGEYTKVKIDLPLQKWHFFVFNYRDGLVDIFVNGNLYHSHNFEGYEIPDYNIAADEITVGEENGLQGVICNTRYHTKPLTKFEITATYNLLMNMNPPINNL